MTFPRIRPSGTWDNGTTVPEAEWEQFDLNLSRALDGFAGGNYAPSSPLYMVGTSKLRADTPVNALDVANKSYVDTALLTPNTQIALIREAVAFEAPISGSGLISGDFLDIDAWTVNEGFTVFTIGGGGDELGMPNYGDADRNGIYLIQVEVEMDNAGNTDNPTHGFIQPMRHDPFGPTTTAIRAAWKGWRWSADDTDTFPVEGWTMWDLTGIATANARFRLRKVGTGTSDISGYVRIYRIGDGDGGGP